MPRLSPWLALLSLGCSELTVPTRDEVQVRSLTAAPAPAPEKSAEAPDAKPRKARRVEAKDQISASHVLVAYKGAKRANPSITRSKEEAKKRASEVLEQLRKGGDFAALAREYSDDSSGRKGGDLGSFGRSSMVKPFADAAFGLKVGEVSDIVESEFGFHVIQRTK
ncbi:MAG TPA: peptidylprolyl isomerase [Polyangiaceae bacterium]|nr:peptidylprolyl isomerase [Polyangiaceae bacterium]